MKIKKYLKLLFLIKTIAILLLSGTLLLVIASIYRNINLTSVQTASKFYEEDLNEILSNITDKSVIAYEGLETRAYLLRNIKQKVISDTFKKIDRSIIVISASRDYTSKASLALYAKIPFWIKEFKNTIRSEKQKEQTSLKIYLLIALLAIFSFILSVLLLNKIYNKKYEYYRNRYYKLNKALQLLENILPDLLKESRGTHSIHPKLQKLASFIETQRDDFYKQKEEFYRQISEKTLVHNIESKAMRENLLEEKAEQVSKANKLVKMGVNNKFLSHILNSLKIPILVLDDLAIVTYANSAFLMQFGLNYDLVISRPLQDLRKYLSDDLTNIIASRIKTVMLSKEPVKYKDMKFVALKGAKAKVFGVTVIFEKK